MCLQQLFLRKMFSYGFHVMFFIVGSILLVKSSGDVLAQASPAATKEMAIQTVCNPFEATCDGWANVAPGMKWRSPGNQRRRNILIVDLQEPGIKVELAHEAVDLGQSLFKRKTLSDLVSEWNSDLRRADSSLNYYAAINATAFDCEDGRAGAPPSPNSILGINGQPYGLLQPGDHFGGRCASFFTYSEPTVDEHLAKLHRPIAGNQEFPYVSCDGTFPAPDAPNFSEFRTAENYIRGQIQSANFAVGYDRTFLADDNHDGVGEYVATEGNRDLKTAVGIGLDSVTGQTRYLYLATWNEESGLFGDNLKEFADELANSGAIQAILLDGGESSQFLSFGQNGAHTNGVKDGIPVLCESWTTWPKTREIINGIVVYHKSTEITVPVASTIAFVIDDTGSMGDEIDDAKETVYRKVNELTAQGQRYDYHLLTYKDDVTYRGATTDDRMIKARVSELYADGGDDCPENMLGALNEIAEKAPNSNAWLMTDAGFHGSEVDVAATLYKLLRNRVIVHPIVYSWCFAAQAAGQTEQGGQTGAASTTAPMLGPEVLAQIAADTGGHYFPIASADTQAATSILLNEMVTESDLAASRDYVTVGAPGTRSIMVDGTATVVNFLLNTYSGYAALTLFDAAGTAVDREAANVTYTELGNAIYYQIDDPAPGLWRAEITGEGEFAFSSSGDTEINFEYLGDAALAKGESEEIVASLSGPIAAAQFQLVTLDGTVVDTINLVDDGLHGDGAARDGTYGGQYTPAREGDFRLQVQGVISESLAVASGMLEADESGPAATSFQRIALEVIHVHSLNVVGNETPVTDDGLAVTYVFSVTNNGATDDTFDLIVSSDQGWADLTGVPTSLALAAGATAQIQITVHIPPTATLGSTNETTLIAVSRLNPLVSDADTVVTEAGIPTVTVAPNAVGLTEGQAQPGGSVIFEIVVENLGRVAMQNAVLHAIIPDHTSFNQDLSLDWPSALCSSPAAGGECAKPLGTIAPGAQVTLRFAVNVDSALPPETRAIRLKTTLTMDNLALPPIAQETEVSLAFRLFLPLIDQ